MHVFNPQDMFLPSLLLQILESKGALTLVFQLGMDRISGSVSGIRRNPAIFSYPVSGRIPDIKKPDIRFSNIRPDIRQTGYLSSIFLILEDLRCFNSLSNSVEQQTDICDEVYSTSFRLKSPSISSFVSICHSVRKFLLFVDNFQYRKQSKSLTIYQSL